MHFDEPNRRKLPTLTATMATSHEALYEYNFKIDNNKRYFIAIPSI